MSYKFVLDTYALVEYATGTEMGRVVKEALDHGQCITPSIVIAELASKYCRENRQQEWDPMLKFLKAKTRVLPLDASLASKSGIQKANLRKRVKDISLVDSIAYQVAIDSGASLVSGDEHFETIPDVIHLKHVEEARSQVQTLLNGRGPITSRSKSSRDP
jgi:predicted nucleic acid-binding protein